MYRTKFCTNFWTRKAVKRSTNIIPMLSLMFVHTYLVCLWFLFKLTSLFEQASSVLKYCQAARCHYIAHYTGGGSKGIKCKCGNSFCFACEKSNHEPVSYKLQRVTLISPFHNITFHYWLATVGLDSEEQHRRFQRKMVTRQY